MTRAGARAGTLLAALRRTVWTDNVHPAGALHVLPRRRGPGRHQAPEVDRAISFRWPGSTSSNLAWRGRRHRRILAPGRQHVEGRFARQGVMRSPLATFSIRPRDGFSTAPRSRAAYLRVLSPLKIAASSWRRRLPPFSPRARVIAEP